jgi:hypothetical protein
LKLNISVRESINLGSILSLAKKVQKQLLQRTSSNGIGGSYKRVMIGLEIDFLLVYTGLGTHRIGVFDLKDGMGKQGLLLDDEIEKDFLYLWRNTKGFEFEKV